MAAKFSHVEKGAHLPAKVTVVEGYATMAAIRTTERWRVYELSGVGIGAYHSGNSNSATHLVMAIFPSVRYSTCVKATLDVEHATISLVLISQIP